MIDSVVLPGDALLRPLAVSDAPALLEAYLRSREHLRPYEPTRPDSFWTLEGQQARLSTLVQQQQDGAVLPCVMLRDGRVLGCATLNTIVRGPFCSASLGYWVDVEEVRQGLASAAVAAMCRIADEQIGLHRIEASVFPANLASQRVLANNGFEQFGLARTYLHINGSWRDALLFQRVLNDRSPSPA